MYIDDNLIVMELGTKRCIAKEQYIFYLNLGHRKIFKWVSSVKSAIISEV